MKKNTKKNTKKPKTRKLLYIVKSKYLDNKWVKKTLKKHNPNWEEYNTRHPQKTHPDYIHVDQHYASDKSLWKYPNKTNDTYKYNRTTQNLTQIIYNKLNILF